MKNGNSYEAAADFQSALEREQIMGARCADLGISLDIAGDIYQSQEIRINAGKSTKTTLEDTKKSEFYDDG